jgi:hypothetical protein
MVSHFLFSYAYFEAAAILGLSKNQLTTKMDKAKVRYQMKIVRITILVLIVCNTLVVIGNFSIYGSIPGHRYDKKVHKWTYSYIPSMFLLIDSVFLLVALLWICMSLSHDE